jgi:DNA-binding NarL/FixJ family response regulator
MRAEGDCPMHMESGKMEVAVRVFVVEDDVSMRIEFERMIAAQQGLTLAGSAESMAAARSLLAHTPCDVAIVDLGLPDGDGSELIAWLSVRQPQATVLVSTVFGDEIHVVRAIEAGARGYLLKDTTAEEFVRSLIAVHTGDVPLSPQIARHLLKRFAPTSTASSRKSASKAAEIDALTPREVDILNHVALGYSAAETATRLSVSVHTVTTHIKRIYGKLAVHNRVAAVNAARSKGLIS